MTTLTGKNIILGVSGSIAAYKSPDIVRRLQDLGAKVIVVLTTGGEKFITKFSLEVVSKNKVFTNLWSNKMEHINLAKWADIVLIAPASANIIATIANGSAKDLLGNIILATTAKLIVSPAMNKQMLINTATKENIQILTQRDIAIIPSDFGIQACGDNGNGRMPEPKLIANFVANHFTSNTLTGKNIIITVGATIEKIDPVRYISNFSSGKMGVALANSCLAMGAKVILVYAKIDVKLPQKSTNIQTLSATSMLKSVQEQIQNNNIDIFISCAAVADFKVDNYAQQKIKKNTNNIVLNLVKNIDILSTVAHSENRPFCIGFAAETCNLIEHANTKLKNKNLDIIIANYVGDKAYGFASDENEVTVITKYLQTKIAKSSKAKIANKIMQIVELDYKKIIYGD